MFHQGKRALKRKLSTLVRRGALVTVQAYADQVCRRMTGYQRAYADPISAKVSLDFSFNQIIGRQLATRPIRARGTQRAVRIRSRTK